MPKQTNSASSPPDHAETLGKKGFSRVALAAMFWSYLRTGIATLITLPTTILLARLLTPTDFGIAAAASIFGQLANNMSSGGMGAALYRTKDLRQEHIRTVFCFNLVLGVAAFGALVAGSSLIGAFYASAQVAAVMPLVALNFLVGAVFTVPQMLLSRDLRYREMSTAGTADLLFASISACLLAWWGFGYLSLILSAIFGAVVKGLLVSYYVKWRPSIGFSRAAAKELFSFGMGAYAANLLHHASKNVDNLVIGNMLGMGPLGFYDKGFSVCHKIYRKMTMVGPAMTVRVFSIIREDQDRFRRAYRKVILSSTLLTYPVLTGLAVAGENLFLVAFGEQWHRAVIPFQILCATFMLKLTATYVGAAAQAHGWMWSQVWRQLVYVILIVLGVALFSRWGIEGAAIGVMVATLITWFISQQLLVSHTCLGWGDILAPQAPATVCAVGIVMVVGGIELLLVTAWDLGRPVRLLAQGLAGTVFYLLFLRFSGFPDVTGLVSDTLVSISPRFKRFVRAAA